MPFVISQLITKITSDTLLLRRKDEVVTKLVDLGEKKKTDYG